MTTYASELSTVGQLFETYWTDCPVFEPNQDADFPKPSNDLANPTRYLAWDLEYEKAVLDDLAGRARIDGRVVVGVWIERRAGAAKLADLVESCRGVFAAHGDAAGFQFLEPKLSDPLEAGGFYGRRLEIPFVRWP